MYGCGPGSEREASEFVWCGGACWTCVYQRVGVRGKGAEPEFICGEGKGRCVWGVGC